MVLYVSLARYDHITRHNFLKCSRICFFFFLPKSAFRFTRGSTDTSTCKKRWRSQPMALKGEQALSLREAHVRARTGTTFDERKTVLSKATSTTCNLLVIRRTLFTGAASLVWVMQAEGRITLSRRYFYTSLNDVTEIKVLRGSRAVQNVLHTLTRMRTHTRTEKRQNKNDDRTKQPFK